MIERITAGMLVIAALTGCASVSGELRTPAAGSCIDVKVPLVLTDTYGLASVEQTIRLTPGLYYSEKEDDQGTYYRAPPGGLSYSRTGEESKPASMLTHMVVDGGVWLPRDPAVKPRFYWIFSKGDVASVAQPAGTECSLAALLKIPDATGQVPWNAGGGTSVVTGNMLYGQGAVAGSIGQVAAGGAIAGSIIDTIIDNDVGKIELGFLPVPKSEPFIATLRQLGRDPIPMKTSHQ